MTTKDDQQAKKALTKKDISWDAKTPLSEYHPSQRGYVAAARQATITGSRFLKNEDIEGEECPYCQVLLRIKRERKGPITAYCPCGYEKKIRLSDDD